MKTKRLLTLAAATLLVGLSMPASAEEPTETVDGECSADADCSGDLICETVDYGYCVDCAAPHPDDDEPSDCESGCYEGSESYCVPPPPRKCSDSDPCDGDDVCVTYTFEQCSGGGSVDGSRTEPACPEDEECEPTQPPEDEFECTEESESYCVPKYYAPCQQDADCGAGFTCEEAEICGCSAGGSIVSPDDDPDGTETPPGEESCVCEPTGEKYCNLVEQACDSDSDCPADLTCQNMGGGSAPIVVDCVDGEDCPEPEPVEEEKYCAPAGYFHYGGGASAPAAVADATGNDESSLRSSERAEFFDVDGDDGDGSSKGRASACSVGLGSEPAGSLLVLLFALVASRFRRRA